ncbi:hypothetical protein [Hymenobacter sp. CRA2]|uniref:hypothetical protein n=1 Tax=Hymenobacter sp. CRA2 TaxID=1955620 RepID=UPI00098FFA14|nr:hypothetical protein [Hymenobacter sp. CRA2]OON68207.1 hypothetical protein B0919_13690 [Hymenobacter sp. CRA2]
MAETPAAAPRFAVDALTLCQVQLLHFTLDDTMPLLAIQGRYGFKSKADILFSSLQADQLRVDVHTDINVPAKARMTGGTKPRVKARIAVVFEYRGLDDLRKNGKLPLQLAHTAVSLAYSTMRGQLQARLAGTSFSGASLPIISPQQLWQPPVPAAE